MLWLCAHDDRLALPPQWACCLCKGGREFVSTEFSSALLSFSPDDPIIGACSTKRKEVIRCRVVSVSATWLGRIVLSGSSLPDSGMKRGG
jgi:hypothetical protein